MSFSLCHLRMLQSALAAVWRHSHRAPTLRQALAAAAGRTPLPTDIVLKLKEKALEVTFDTGERFRYPAEYLRVESTGAVKEGHIVHGRRHVGIMAIEPVGSYAVRLQFDDLDSSGIYTWQHLHELGTHKLSRMRDYIRLLRRHGLSRDPPGLRRQPRPAL